MSAPSARKEQRLAAGGSRRQATGATGSPLERSAGSSAWVPHPRPCARLFSCRLLHREGAPRRRGGRARGGLGDRGPHAVGAPPGGLVLPAVGAAGADRARRALDRDPLGALLLLHG